MNNSVSSLLLLVLILFCSPLLRAQEKDPVFVLNGYVSTMQSVMFEKADEPWTNDNLIHNRLNSKLFLGKSVTVVAELRNRLFTGDMVRYYEGYADNIGSDIGWADLSWNIIDENSVLLNSTLDRFYIDINGKGFQFTAGRQRINWGQTFVWNPNDIFNTYSYFDFDYVERPGSDAARLQIFPSYSSVVEIAAKVNSEDELTAAALVRVNRWGYDFQFIGGYVNSEDIMVGTGWSGNLGGTSFRGEISWFEPVVHTVDSAGTGLFTVGIDRAFSNNSMLQLQFMYCNKPVSFDDFGSFYSGTLSAKELAISEYSVFAAYTIPVTPLFNLGVSSIIYPDLKGLFFGPTIDISLSEDIDFSMVWQHFNARPDGEHMTMNLGFLRIKYSF